MKKIVLCNDGVDSANKGDQAILRAMLPDLRERFPDARIEVFSYSGTRSPRRVLKLLRAIVGCDTVILGGGHPFQDLTSQFFLLFGLFLIGVAKSLGKKVFCLGVGAGPVESSLGKAVTGPVVNMAERIGVRDRLSMELLEQLGVRDDKMELTADLAFSLPSAGRDRGRAILEAEGIPQDETPAVGISLRRWFHFSHRFLPGSTRRVSVEDRQQADRTDRAYVRFLDSLVDDWGVRLVFVPMRKARSEDDYGQDDDRYSEEIREKLCNRERTFVLKGDYTPEELKAVLGLMDTVIAVRMHAIILAASSGVPVMGIAITPAKGQGVFEVLSLESGYLPVESLDGPLLRERFSVLWQRRKETEALFRKRMKNWNERALKNYEILGGHEG
ncbi:MAG TPA: polysaccharide pyruvyl transferase family protein [Syntrophales bacterium]|nr:polysaccharide pyruvyl transferase family protein [Syntrophales bacterium]